MSRPVEVGSLKDVRQIGSPRSLAALDAQGILPRELAYKPLEVFQLPGLDPRVVQLRYEFMESRRQDLLSAARATREIIIELAEEAEREGEEGGDGRKRHWHQADLAQEPCSKALRGLKRVIQEPN